MDGAVLVCAAGARDRWADLLGACGVEVVSVGEPGDGPADAEGSVAEGTALSMVLVVGDDVGRALVDVATWRTALGRVPLLVALPELDAAQVPSVLRAGADGVLPADVGCDAVARAVAGFLRGEVVMPRAAVASLVDAAREAPLPARGRVATLSPREVHVLRRLSRGLTVAEIALEWGVAETTVRSHLSRAMTKLRVRDRGEAVALLAATH